MVQGKVLPLSLIGVGLIILVLSIFFFPSDPGPEVVKPDGDGHVAVENDGETSTPLPPNSDVGPPLVIDGPRMRFAGQVIDVSTGLAVPGATVAFRDLSGSRPLGHSRTRAGGEFAVDIPECNAALITVRGLGLATGRWQWGPEMLPDAESSTDAHPEDLFLTDNTIGLRWRLSY
jgi:hypothetical protein